MKMHLKLISYNSLKVGKNLIFNFFFLFINLQGTILFLFVLISYITVVSYILSGNNLHEIILKHSHYREYSLENFLCSHHYIHSYIYIYV